jgi:hypothetical protein
MANTPKRKPRVPISVSMLHPDWVRTQRAAAMQGMTMSEYCRAAIRKENTQLLDAGRPIQQAA